MTDQMQSDEDSGQFNPYAPGEAAVEGVREREVGSAGRIADSEPPDEPTVGRFLENFPVVLARFVGPVGGVSVLLMIGFVVMAAVGIVSVVSPGTARAIASDTDPGLPWTIGLVVLVLYAHLGVVWAGPMRAIRRVAFEGPSAVPGFGRAFGLSLQRWWPLVVLVVTVTLAVGCLRGCVAGTVWFVAAEVGGLTEVSWLLGWLVWAVVILPCWASLYIVSVTDQSVRQSLRDSYDLLLDHPGYSTVGFVIVTGIVFGFGIKVPDLLFEAVDEPGLVIPLLLAVVAIVLVSLSLSAVAYATLFATIEETDFDFRDGRPPSRPRHPPRPNARRRGRRRP
jgi:hypothetical protein